uniref:Uncharacterized protein n=1 Tax=Phytophthora ramorum TaxID=164328 RepID=H3H409_PHYRM
MATSFLYDPKVAQREHKENGSLDPQRASTAESPADGDAAEQLGVADRVAVVRWVTCEKDPSFYYESFKGIDSGVLEGDNPVADLTALRPYMEALPSAVATEFERTYREMIAAAYPKQSDGNTIFNLRRVFVMATKPL